MTEPTPAEGKATTNKKSFASKNLNTTLQAVASKAEAPRAPPPSNAGRLTVITGSKHSSQSQGFGSSESSSRSDGLKNLASVSAPPSAPQLGLSKEEDSHQPHRESPRGASSSDGLPRASNIWSSRQQQAERSRPAPPASSYPPHDGRGGGEDPPPPHQQRGPPPPPPPPGPGNDRWGPGRKERGSTQDGRVMDRAADYDGHGYGYGRPQDSRRSSRPPGSPDGGGGWGGSRWGENKQARPGYDGPGDHPRQPPAAGGWGRSSSWDRDREMGYGGGHGANGGGGWGRSSSNLSYSSQGAEEPDSGSGWGEHPSTSWGGGWGQSASAMRPQEPPQAEMLPPPASHQQPQQHYLYNHQTDSMQPANAASTHHPHSKPHHFPPAEPTTAPEHAPPPPHPPAPRKPSGPVMGTVQILRAEPGSHHAPGASPPKPPTPKEAPPQKEAEAADGAAHEGSSSPSKQPHEASGHEAEKPVAMTRDRSNSNASSSGGGNAPRQATRGGKKTGSQPHQQHHNLDQPWEKVALPSGHAKGFKARGGGAVPHHEEGGDGHHAKKQHGGGGPRPPAERDMSEEAVARREARRKEREARGPRIKGVLYRRMPDGKVVLVDPPTAPHKGGKENGGAHHAAGPAKEKEAGHADNQHSRKGPHTSAEGGKQPSSGKAKGGGGSAKPRQQPAPVVQVSMKDVIGGKQQKQQQQAGKAGSGGKA